MNRAGEVRRSQEHGDGMEIPGGGGGVGFPLEKLSEGRSSKNHIFTAIKLN